MSDRDDMRAALLARRRRDGLVGDAGFEPRRKGVGVMRQFNLKLRYGTTDMLRLAEAIRAMAEAAVMVWVNGVPLERVSRKK